MNAIPDGHLARFGFDSRAETHQSSIGDPLKVYTIEPDALLAYDGGQEMSELLSPTEIWLFPVICADRARVLLTVSRLRGRWQGVDIGGAVHATELERVARDWPRDAGCELHVVKVYQANSTFVCAIRDGTSHLIPLAGTARAIQLIDPGEPYDYSELSTAEAVARLTPLVRENLSAGGIAR
jgi:hypothetical protein